jgi:RNA polymerase sigma factor (sigma-70 family)
MQGGSRTWQVERDRLVGLAYRMLGSVFEAEEVVQEAFLRLHRTQGVDRPGQWLTTVVSRLCLDQLGSARARREVYVGQWLPEPMVTQPAIDDELTLAESVTTAMLVVLETLSPLERVVFVLREAFGFDYAAIASALGRSSAAVRQLASRARQHVQARRPRFEIDAAWRGGPHHARQRHPRAGLPAGRAGLCGGQPGRERRPGGRREPDGQPRQAPAPAPAQHRAAIERRDAAIHRRSHRSDEVASMKSAISRAHGPGDFGNPTRGKQHFAMVSPYPAHPGFRRGWRR